MAQALTEGMHTSVLLDSFFFSLHLSSLTRFDDATFMTGYGYEIHLLLFSDSLGPVTGYVRPPSHLEGIRSVLLLVWWWIWGLTG